ncbi:hypothetical protein CON39_11585 [Bacillus thuringiensis]|uniref:helix-turn-helix domain-containing protein n=1 Tax=Bacillus thuringiensis TaxID=1428 RepID=UPI000BEE46C8|nr:helix-turn-helix transcriptional regulator [Bacillus thuringiensis]PEF30308.1 hypothetical protein CON39_11585 [Bacillus thuringiensis]
MDKHLTAKRIKELRLKKGLSQKMLADKMGVTFPYISMIESTTNDKSPSREKVSLLAEIFNVSTDYLLGLSNTDDLLPYSDTRREFDSIIEIVEQLDDDKRVMVIKMIQSMVKSI